jgi:hypothetical protein
MDFPADQLDTFAMTHDDFREIERAVAKGHADMADRLSVSEVSVKRYATGTQPIPGHVAKLAVALLLVEDESLQKKFEKLLAKYHGDTYD